MRTQAGGFRPGFVWGLAVLILSVGLLLPAPVSAQPKGAPAPQGPSAEGAAKPPRPQAIPRRDDTKPVLDAHTLYESGRLDAAITAYKEVLVAFPDTMHMEAVLYRLGDALDRQNRLAEAAPYWEKLIADFPDHPEIPRIEDRLLVVYREQKKFSSALQILLRQMGRAPVEQKGALLREVALTRLELSDTEHALRDLVRRISQYLTPEQAPAAEEEIRNLVGKIPVADLEPLADKFTERVPGEWIVARLAHYHAGRGDQFQTSRWVDRYLNAFPAGSQAAGMEQLIQTQEEQILKRTHRVGLFLHLSGDLKGFGEQVRRGAQLAYDTAAPKLPGNFLGLWVYDMDGPAPLLGGHLRKLLRHASPEVVVGPMLSSEVAEYAHVARNEGVPMIAPLVERPEEGGDGVVGLGVSPAMEGVAAARHAFGTLHLNKMIVLYADTAYGRAVKEAFVTEFAGLGGQVNMAAPFQPDGGDASQALRKIIKDDTEHNGGIPGITQDQVKQAHRVAPDAPPLEVRLYEPGFDGVFMAGNWEQTVLVAPHLPFNDITTPLIGSGAWNDPRLLRNAGGAVIGAEFPAVFFRGTPQAQAFITAYHKIYDSDPGLFVALGYDAMNLAIRALRSGNAAEGVAGPFDGVTGHFEVGADGTVVRSLSMLRVSRRGLTEVARVSLKPRPGGGLDVLETTTASGGEEVIEGLPEEESLPPAGAPGSGGVPEDVPESPMAGGSAADAASAPASAPGAAGQTGGRAAAPAPVAAH
ncbi:MAG: penicillin-binding protein activator [Nitrospirota bacterium]|nr:penicillin-binding protein activator [Nitrospirota bacterium]